MPDRRRPASDARQQQGAAEQLAIAALAFIAAEHDRFARFVDLSGITVDSIRAFAHEPDFLAGVLDHLVSDEALLVTFAAENEIDPHDVLATRDLLAGVHGERNRHQGASG
jgi:Protein of unknown function (DUF3572)